MKYEHESVTFSAQPSASVRILRIAVLMLAIAGVASVGKVVMVDVMQLGRREAQASAVLRDPSAALQERIDAVFVKQRAARDAIRELCDSLETDSELRPHVRNALDSLRGEIR